MQALMTYFRLISYRRDKKYLYKIFWYVANN